MRKRTVHVLGGGTVYHVRPLFALCSPSFGRTATKVAALAREAWGPGYDVHLHLTRMASGGRSDIETNGDVETLLKSLVNDPMCCAIFMAASLCDYEGHVLDGATTTDSGLFLPKLRKPDGRKVMIMEPAADLTAEIRRYRRDVVLVGFSTTSGASDDDMFAAGALFLGSSDCDLVLASDFTSKSGVVIEAERWIGREGLSKDRDTLLRGLVAGAHALSEARTGSALSATG